MISRAYRSASSLHRFLRGLLGGQARPFMTSSPARLLGLFQVSERLLQPIRRAIGHVRPLLTGYYTLSSLLLPPCPLPRPWTVCPRSYDAGGKVVERPELRPSAAGCSRSRLSGSRRCHGPTRNKGSGW